MDQEIDTSQRILEESEQLFFRYGVKSITMDEIATHLGISKKTIYQFYKDKKELVLKVVERRMRNQETQISEIAKKASDSIQEIILTSEWMYEFFKNLNPYLMMEIQKYYPKAYQAFLAHKHNCIFSHIYENMKKGIETGLYRANIDIDTMARLRLISLEASFDPNNFPIAKNNLHDLHVQLIEHFLYGICTLKGHKLVNKYKQIKEEE